MVFNITKHVQGVQYLLRCWRSDGVLNLNTHFYSVVFDLFCIFRENTHEQQLIQAKILYQCPSRNILDFVYGGSHFSTGVIFLRVRHVKNRPLWHFFYTWDTFFYGQGSFLYDEKWPLGRFSTGVVFCRYTGLLRKYRGSVHDSVVIMVGEAEPSPTMFTTDPLYLRGRSAINLITNLLHRWPLFCTYFALLSHFKMAPLLDKILTSLFLGWSENNLHHWIERKILWFIF